MINKINRKVFKKIQNLGPDKELNSFVLWSCKVHLLRDRTV